MKVDIGQVDLDKLNSMTKYPSILTYHALGDKGVLQETVQIPFEGRIIGTEKVDGTNARLIFCLDQSGHKRPVPSTLPRCTRFSACCPSDRRIPACKESAGGWEPKAT
jgi:hypothetical protein